MDWIIKISKYFIIREKEICFSKGVPELSMTGNCRVNCILYYSKENLIGERVGSLTGMFSIYNRIRT